MLNVDPAQLTNAIWVGQNGVKIICSIRNLVQSTAIKCPKQTAKGCQSGQTQLTTIKGHVSTRNHRAYVITWFDKILIMPMEEW